jgi:hypothetical protein
VPPRKFTLRLHLPFIHFIAADCNTETSSGVPVEVNRRACMCTIRVKALAPSSRKWPRGRHATNSQKKRIGLFIVREKQLRRRKQLTPTREYRDDVGLPKALVSTTSALVILLRLKEVRQESMDRFQSTSCLLLPAKISSDGRRHQIMTRGSSPSRNVGAARHDVEIPQYPGLVCKSKQHNH